MKHIGLVRSRVNRRPIRYGMKTVSCKRGLNKKTLNKSNDIENCHVLFPEGEYLIAKYLIMDMPLIRVGFSPECSKIMHIRYHSKELSERSLKAVCHVSDWPLQSEINTTDFFVKLNKGGLIFLTFYGRRKSEDHQPFKFPILCIVIITQSNA